LLDAEGHNTIYNSIAAKLCSPAYLEVAKVMNYIIIRGTYTEFAVILNAAEFNREIIHKFKLLAEYVKSHHSNVSSCFAFLDESRSEYFLDQSQPIHNPIQSKKLFGFDMMRIEVCAKKFFVPATGFTQINESILPAMIENVRTLLRPEEDERLFDLYCGYGMFAHSFADEYSEIIGVDIAGESIQSAKKMAEKTTHKARMKFIAGSISPTLIEHLPRAQESDVILLDPPRSGIDDETIEAIATRHPKKIVHVFCNMDEVVNSLRSWKKHRYHCTLAQPLDMFAGTPNLELCCLLEKNTK
jgi:2-polyprenyl-3-methyl-5-hydroxy-6-metoxy-1,4-benzoquinol methylase